MDADVLLHRLQATAAVATDPARDVGAPQEFSLVGRLQAPFHLYRGQQHELQPRQRRIVSSEHPVGADRPTPKIPEIHPEHSH